MSKTLFFTAFLSSLFILPSISLAEESLDKDDLAKDSQAETPPSIIWSGNTELGFIQTTGNSSTQSFNGKFNLVRDQQPLKTAFKFEALTSEENGDVSKEKHLSEFKIDFSLNEYDYLTSLISYEDDRFSGYQYQSTLSLSYGYRAWNDDQGKLDLEIGPGYRRNALEAPNDQGKKVEEEAVGRLGLNLEVKLSDNALFTEVINVEGGDSNIVYKSDMGLQSKLIGSLAMKINYQVKHTEEVPEDTEHTDSTIGFTLVYDF